jgi:glycosyltransferase involved in cell wall biosynthesis
MSEERLVSIIINNYNYGTYLKDAIESCLNQTYTNTEVIVVDDGSTDNSRQIISSYGDLIIPVLKQNGGQGSTFNSGFNISRGYVIIFLDADDMLRPTAVEHAVESFNDSNVIKVHWPVCVINISGEEIGQLLPKLSLPEGDLREIVFQLGPTNTISPPTSGNAWLRSFLSLILPVPEELYRAGADTYLYELAPFFGTLKKIEEPQSLYRLHGRNNYLSIPLEKRLERQLGFYENICSVLRDHFGTLEGDLINWKENSWWHYQTKAMQEIIDYTKPGDKIILVEDQPWESGNIADREIIPFLERDGKFWGLPLDDHHAIIELNRLRNTGANYIILTWPSFWWLDYYKDFTRYLRSKFRCVLENDRLVAFDLWS